VECDFVLFVFRVQEEWSAGTDAVKGEALPGEPKDGEFNIMDVEKGVERTIRVGRQSKERDGRKHKDKW
jgi:hypothetical protein